MEDQIPPVILQEEKPVKIGMLNKIKENPLIFILILIVFLGIALGTAGLASRNKDTKKEETKPKPTPISSDSIVYGYWMDNTSVIEAVDLSTNKIKTLASLSFNIKHVRIINSDNIIYIKDTDERDYGKEIVKMTLSTKEEKLVLKADDGFGIDDYILSPNKKLIAVWEVSPSDGSVELLGGRSRVYTLDAANVSQKNLIYDQSSGPGQPVDYPIAISDTGELFTDRFLPNSGAGWGYGMKVSNPSGSSKEDISSMQNGRISTQPVVSRDGKRIVFAGYDGSKGPGTEEIDGFRRAMITPNTIEIFDLTTRKEKTLLSAAEGDIFPNAKWDLLSGNIIYSQVSKDNSKSGNYIYDLATSTSRKINLGSNSLGTFEQKSSAVKNVTAAISSDSFLVFDEVVSNETLGNLGSKYNQSINSVYILDTTSQTKKTISLGAGLVQFIDLEPEKYFSSLNSSASSESDRNKKQLQLQTFEIKPSLAPKRIAQQSRPPREKQCSLSDSRKKAGELCNFQCENLARQQCNDLLGQYNPKDNAQALVWDACWVQAVKDIKVNGKCSDSPLYLYGAEGQSVSVYSSTPIYPLDTSYSPSEGYSISLGENGSFTANGKKVSSLKFDYTPAIKLEKPKKGYLAKKENVQNIVEKILDQLGLNEKETQDTLNFVKEKASSSYIFISFYDDATSKKILPLIISPTPDTYRNIVFYIENLDENPNSSYAPPIIEKIQRKGFTAIEISFVVR
ncbi:MAG: hypothetical protein AAB675_04725 [Patescibacteria group bacterium]